MLILPDFSHEVMVRAIEDAFSFSDVLVVTGGVSMGEKVCNPDVDCKDSIALKNTAKNAESFVLL